MSSVVHRAFQSPTPPSVRYTGVYDVCNARSPPGREAGTVWRLQALYARMVWRTGIVTALGLLLAGVAGCGSSADVQLLSLDCGSSYVHLQTAKGRIENISAQPLRGIVALVTFRYASRTDPQTVPAKIYSSELRPGGTSWFEARTFGNRGFSRCDVVFTDGAGRPIAHASG